MLSLTLLYIDMLVGTLLHSEDCTFSLNVHSNDCRIHQNVISIQHLHHILQNVHSNEYHVDMTYMSHSEECDIVFTEVLISYLHHSRCNVH